MRGELSRAKGCAPCSSYRLYELSGSRIRQFRDRHGLDLARELDVSGVIASLAPDHAGSGRFFKVASQGFKLEFMCVHAREGIVCACL